VPVSGSGNVSGGRLSSAVETGTAMPDDSLVTRSSPCRNMMNATSASATVAAVATIAVRA
jgi:hypothetical protein